MILCVLLCLSYRQWRPSPLKPMTHIPPLPPHSFLPSPLLPPSHPLLSRPVPSSPLPFPLPLPSP